MCDVRTVRESSTRASGFEKVSSPEVRSPESDLRSSSSASSFSVSACVRLSAAILSCNHHGPQPHSVQHIRKQGLPNDKNKRSSARVLAHLLPLNFVFQRLDLRLQHLGCACVCGAKLAFFLHKLVGPQIDSPLSCPCLFAPRCKILRQNFNKIWPRNRKQNRLEPS